MPRDVNGNYSLPAGNPVVTNTVISSVWANTTLSDLSTAMTNSLDRTGTSAGMTGQFKATSGAIGAPGISFGSEPTSGIYRAGAGDFRFSIAGVDVLKFGTALTPIGQIFAPNGLIGAPAYSWVNEPASGLYRAGAGDQRYSVGGTGVLQFQAAAVTALVNFVGSAGVNATQFVPTGAGVPSVGMYLPGVNQYGFAAGTIARGKIDANGAWTINIPTVGAALTINGLNNSDTVSIVGGATSAQSFALRIQGGTTSADYALRIINAANTLDYFKVRGDGLTQAMDQSNTLQDVGWRDAPQNAQTGNYTLALSDRGKSIYYTGAGAVTLTIPANASIAFPVGTMIFVANNSAGNISIAITTDRLLLSPSGATGTRTLATAGVATLYKDAATGWFIFGSGIS